ncbi:hypothetical protein HPB52_013073 [Rhipicephalus sanguineus]|uniref:Uncharacterized protein n=1 Tax=Rhipicephalus sanguineus TaxID=34632 RepID=A0A9D4SXA3_RHISA|nr:hypothetical protein HPB52_013073 [Rhipicephalus sanguineus]
MASTWELLELAERMGLEGPEFRAWPVQCSNGNTITARDLLEVLQEKDRLLSTLLERLTVAGPAEPQPAPTFQVIPELSQNISAVDGSEDAPSAREWIENIRRTSMFHGLPAPYTLETAKARLVGAARDW